VPQHFKQVELAVVYYFIQQFLWQHYWMASLLARFIFDACSRTLSLLLYMYSWLLSNFKNYSCLSESIHPTIFTQNIIRHFISRINFGSKVFNCISKAFDCGLQRNMCREVGTTWSSTYHPNSCVMKLTKVYKQDQICFNTYQLYKVLWFSTTSYWLEIRHYTFWLAVSNDMVVG